MTSPIYLPEAEVERLALSASEIADAMVAAFQQRADGQIAMPDKTRLSVAGSDAFFHAMPAAAPDLLAGVKWVAGSPMNAVRGLPHIDSLLVLSDPTSGRTLAIIEARYLTGLRTAALSLLAARYLARPNAARLGLIGCGLQASTHVEALCAEFPIRSVAMFSRRRASAEALAERIRARDLATLVCDVSAAVVAQSDLVVTSVPAQPGLAGFLDADALPPGAFAAMVDLGRSWRAETVHAFDRGLTDDVAQSRAMSGENPTFAAMHFAGDLSGLCSGRVAARRGADERLAFLFPGNALADLVAGRCVLDRLGRV